MRNRNYVCQSILKPLHCVIVTEWEQFKALTPADFVKNMAEPILVDARRIYDPQQFRDKLTFSAVGLSDDSISHA